MSIRLKKRSMILKTAQVSLSILISRLLGLVRTVLVARFLGATPAAEAFQVAYLIPSTLRKIFAEGALSAAFVPSFVQEYKKGGRKATDALMSTVMLVVQGFLLFVCGFVWLKTELLLHLITPGWFSNPTLMASQIQLTVHLIRILVFLIMSFSTCALMAGALNSTGHFAIPAFASVFLNLLFIPQIIVAMHYNLPVSFLAYGMLLAGGIVLLMHIITYRANHLSLAKPTAQAWKTVKAILARFVNCSISGGALVINSFIDMSFATYFQQGTVAIVYYAQAFSSIPHTVFVTSFTTILLPQCSHIALYARKRLGFYLLEAAKFVAWLSIPTMFFVGFFAHEILETTLQSQNFTADHVARAAPLLIAFTMGLFFISMNKVILQMFYACQKTALPAIICLCGTASNFVLNLLLMKPLGPIGLAVATTSATGIQLCLYLIGLKKHLGFNLYFGRFFTFLRRYLFQLACFLVPAYLVYRATYAYSHAHLSPAMHHLLFHSLLLWAWTGCAYVMIMWGVYRTKKRFHIRMYFISSLSRKNKRKKRTS